MNIHLPPHGFIIFVLFISIPFSFRQLLSPQCPIFKRISLTIYNSTPIENIWKHLVATSSFLQYYILSSSNPNDQKSLSRLFRYFERKILKWIGKGEKKINNFYHLFPPFSYLFFSFITVYIETPSNFISSRKGGRFSCVWKSKSIYFFNESSSTAGNEGNIMGLWLSGFKILRPGRRIRGTNGI